MYERRVIFNSHRIKAGYADEITNGVARASWNILPVDSQYSAWKAFDLKPDGYISALGLHNLLGAADEYPALPTIKSAHELGIPVLLMATNDGADELVEGHEFSQRIGEIDIGNVSHVVAGWLLELQVIQIRDAA